MSRALKFAAAGLFVVIVLFIWLKANPGPQRVEPKTASSSTSVLAAFGRVEGREETIFLGASADGVVQEVLVKDGQTVGKGALLAVIECNDISSAIDVAKAQADAARQSRIRLLRGHRDEERRAAAQATEAANAALGQAQDHFGRVNTLGKGEISREAIEQARHDLEVAQANHEKAVAEQNLTDAGPLPEEISRADAEVVAAEQSVKVASDKLEKCKVRAPIAGTVLKVMTKVGESYSTLLPHPIFTIADETVRRIRAEVDERDISKVKLGQASIVTADGFPGQKFDGQVVEISHAMKPKSVMSDDPSQKVDRDVLEVIIELNHASEELPLGLRVTAQLNDAAAPGAPASLDPSQSSHKPVLSPAAATPSPSAEAPTPLIGDVLQVGVMAHKENADALAAALKKENFPAFVLARHGDPYFRVDVGPYSDSAEALTVKDKLKAGGYGLAIERQYPASNH